MRTRTRDYSPQEFMLPTEGQLLGRPNLRRAVNQISRRVAEIVVARRRNASSRRAAREKRTKRGRANGDGRRERKVSAGQREEPSNRNYSQGQSRLTSSTIEPERAASDAEVLSCSSLDTPIETPINCDAETSPHHFASTPDGLSFSEPTSSRFNGFGTSLHSFQKSVPHAAVTESGAATSMPVNLSEKCVFKDEFGIEYVYYGDEMDYELTITPLDPPTESVDKATSTGNPPSSPPMKESLEATIREEMVTTISSSGTLKGASSHEGTIAPAGSMPVQEDRKEVPGTAMKAALAITTETAATTSGSLQKPADSSQASPVPSGNVGAEEPNGVADSSPLVVASKSDSEILSNDEPILAIADLSIPLSEQASPIQATARNRAELTCTIQVHDSAGLMAKKRDIDAETTRGTPAKKMKAIPPERFDSEAAIPAVAPTGEERSHPILPFDSVPPRANGVTEAEVTAFMPAKETHSPAVKWTGISHAGKPSVSKNASKPPKKESPQSLLKKIQSKQEEAAKRREEQLAEKIRARYTNLRGRHVAATPIRPNLKDKYLRNQLPGNTPRFPRTSTPYVGMRPRGLAFSAQKAFMPAYPTQEVSVVATPGHAKDGLKDPLAFLPAEHFARTTSPAGSQLPADKPEDARSDTLLPFAEELPTSSAPLVNEENDAGRHESGFRPDSLTVSTASVTDYEITERLSSSDEEIEVDDNETPKRIPRWATDDQLRRAYDAQVQSTDRRKIFAGAPKPMTLSEVFGVEEEAASDRSSAHWDTTSDYDA